MFTDSDILVPSISSKNSEIVEPIFYKLKYDNQTLTEKHILRIYSNTKHALEIYKKINETRSLRYVWVGRKKETEFKLCYIEFSACTGSYSLVLDVEIDETLKKELESKILEFNIAYNGNDILKTDLISFYLYME